jgi:hypothetical protein
MLRAIMTVLATLTMNTTAPAENQGSSGRSALSGVEPTVREYRARRGAVLSGKVTKPSAEEPTGPSPCPEHLSSTASA